MGLFTGTLTILLLAISAPLVYRQFATDTTVQYMNSYYSNYQSVDRFLRQSAGHIDRAKEYLPTREQIQDVASTLKEHVAVAAESAIKTLSKLKQADQSSKASAVDQKAEKHDPGTGVEPDVKYSSCPGEDTKGHQIRLWTSEELAKYDGNSDDNSDILLSFLGLVYNVTANREHYGKGAEYNVFSGRDATRAYVTGNFTHDLNDDISDMADDDYHQVDTWASFYASNYPALGRLVGRYYNEQGCPTQTLVGIYNVIDRLDQEKIEAHEVDKQLPECNSEWNSDLKKGRVWCSTKSGGIERSWAGVPRIYRSGGYEKCVCFNEGLPNAAELSKQLYVYQGCDPKAEECTMAQPA